MRDRSGENVVVIERPDQPFLAVDWGTTNRRIYLLQGGTVQHTQCDNRGASVIDDFDREVADFRKRFGGVPMLLAGMVGSTIGWHGTDYVPAPAGIADLRRGLLHVDERTAIVPGVSTTARGRVDVMRGEEVQLLGAVAVGSVPSDALVVQPGTHAKWAIIENGQLVDFTTAMTGELFALLRNHSILAPDLQGTVEVGAAFRDGVAASGRHDLAAALFGIRAHNLMGQRIEDAAGFASGLLIGGEVAARLGEHPHATVHVLSDAGVGRLYAAAIAMNGRSACIVDSQNAFVAGMKLLGAAQS